MNLKIQNASIQRGDRLVKLVGLLPADMLVRMMDEVSLKPNPRSPNVNKITRAIDETLETAPEMLQYRTKGILMAGNFVERSGDAFEIDFQTPDYGGILDGGHNFFSLVRNLVIEAMKVRYPSMRSDDKRNRKESQKIKSWQGLVDFWKVEGRNVIEFVSEVMGADGKRKAGEKIWKKMSFLVPVEVLSPADGVSSRDVQAMIHDISVARNNNVQLAAVAIAGHKGSYECLKQILPEKLNRKIMWKAGENQCPIPATRIVTLAMLPLDVLSKAGFLRKLDLAIEKAFQSEGDASDEFKLPAVRRVSMYTSTGNCVKVYSEIADGASNLSDCGADDDLLKESLFESLGVISALPSIWDSLEANFEALYRRIENRVSVPFEEIPCNGKKGPLRHDTATRFLERTIPAGCYSVPSGFVIPLFSVIAEAFMRYDHEVERVIWEVDPSRIIEEIDNPDDTFDDLFADYAKMMETDQCDPQKVGKNVASYEMFENYRSVQDWISHVKEFYREMQ